jgi:hypothetical protein
LPAFSAVCPLAIFTDVDGDKTSTAGGGIAEMLGQIGEYTFYARYFS